MSVQASDIVEYLAANMPTDDASTAGGAIDATMRSTFTQLAANDTVTAISTSASDTQNLTVVGRNAAGSIVSQTIAMNGITGVNLGTLGTIERILSAKLASAAVGTVTVARGTAASVGPTIGTITPGEKGFAAFAQQEASDPSSTSNRYFKTFLKNTHGSLSALSAVVKENADPDNRSTFWLATAVNDSATVANRITAPGGSAFSNSNQNVPGTDLASGSAIGVWRLISLPAADPVHRTTVTMELDFSST